MDTLRLDPSDNPPKVRGVAANLNKARNDTGRVAFCGPTVLSAITGQPVGAIEDIIRHDRDLPAGAKPVVKGTHAEEVAATLARFGYRMDLVASFLDRDRKERPTVWSWMQKRRNAWSYYILAIHRGRQGHWILIKGVMLCDTYTDGAWTFVCDGPHRGARIMEVFEVKGTNGSGSLALAT